MYYKGLTYCHHGTAAGASDEDLLGICLVLCQSPLDHVCNGVAITATLVFQGLLAANVPAGSRVRRARVDDNKAILLGKSLVGTAVEVCLRRSSAVVDSHNDTRRRSELLGYVDVEACFGRGISEGSDLG